MRFTIDEYSRQFKMSKEMINSKLRSKRLNYIIEDGTTYIIVTRSSLNQEKREEIHKENLQKKSQQSSSDVATTQKTTVGMILSLYQRENEQLKQKIKKLEDKIDSLINDKEQMLRDERDRIEQLYSTKDEQLKNILELINKKFLLEQKKETVHEVSVSEFDSINATFHDDSSIVELKHYLRSLDLESYQRKIIKKRFLDARDNDIRVIEQNGKIYLDFDRYDYTDLLRY